MSNYTILQMFENTRRGRQARNFTTNAPKILDLKSSSEQIFSRKLPLGAPVQSVVVNVYLNCIQIKLWGVLTQENLITSLSRCIVLIFEILLQYQFILKLLRICNFPSHAFINVRTRIKKLRKLYKTVTQSHLSSFILYVIDCLLGYFASASM